MPSQTELADLSAIAQEAAIIAGSMLVEGFSQAKEIQYKDGIHNLVTQFDTASEAAIIEFIQRHFPSHHFLAEEGGGNTRPGGYRWVIDPLDGTVNFAHGIPIFSVSIAVELDGDLLAGVVHQPMTRELFSAVRGHGAKLNGEAIRVSSAESLVESILVTGFPYNAADNAEHTMEQFGALVNMGVPIRRLGSAAVDLAYVACGRFDGFWESSLQPWDVAAGSLLVREAGGIVTDFQGEYHQFDCPTILATNARISQEFVSFLARFR